jgi:SAM-dependent methyltransferase
VNSDTKYDNSIWDEVYNRGYIANYPNDHVIKFVFNNFARFENNKKNIKILDIGCGGGNNTWMMAKEGYDVYGFDGSEKALALAQKKLENEKLTATLSLGKFLSLPYEDAFFDAVNDDAAIEANMFNDIKAIFKEVFRVLKTNGKYHGMLVSIDSKASFKGEEIEKDTILVTDGRPFIKRKGLFHFFDAPKIKNLLSETGFSDIDVNYFIDTRNNGKNIIKWWIVDAIKI